MILATGLVIERDLMAERSRIGEGTKAETGCAVAYPYSWSHPTRRINPPEVSYLGPLPIGRQRFVDTLPEACYTPVALFWEPIA